jgi:spore germination cell wall hydrolase CwlJ-like protein
MSVNIMFNFLLYKAQILTANIRRSWPFYGVSRYVSDVTFFAMIFLPFVALGFIFRFAYVDQLQVQLEQQRHADLTCLARNVYFESRGESIEGQYAVAEVTLNRVKSKRFPDNVCSVVHEKRWDSIRKRDVGAFSWTELDSLSKPKGKPWERAAAVAIAAYDNQETPKVPGALFYHAERVTPRWSRSKKLVAEIGRHKFYE